VGGKKACLNRFPAFSGLSLVLKYTDSIYGKLADNVFRVENLFFVSTSVLGPYVFKGPPVVTLNRKIFLDRKMVFSLRSIPLVIP
jgi:hypothetical protein